MKAVTSLKRYVDDCTGLFVGSEREFRLWERKVRDLLLEYGLTTDEFVLKMAGDPLPFLDIQFYFESDGNLQTDIYRKPTDSLSFLNFSSHHPNHIFSSVVYSQCVRYRRIINCNSRFHTKLKDLEKVFLDSGYPSKMVRNISGKVRTFTRDISEKGTVTSLVPPPPVPINIVSTYGADGPLRKILKLYEPKLKETFLFSSVGPLTV